MNVAAQRVSHLPVRRTTQRSATCCESLIAGISLNKRLDHNPKTGYIKSLDQKWREAMDIHERLAALEAKLETR